MKIYIYVGGTLSKIIGITELVNKGESFWVKNNYYLTAEIKNIHSFNFNGFYSLKKLSDKERETLRKKYVWF